MNIQVRVHMYRIYKDNDIGRFVSCKGDTVYVHICTVQYCISIKKRIQRLSLKASRILDNLFVI